MNDKTSKKLKYLQCYNTVDLLLPKLYGIEPISLKMINNKDIGSKV